MAVAVSVADRLDFQESVRGFLAARSRVRTDMQSAQGYDRALWTEMTEQLGVAGLHTDEQLGGSGFGVAELATVFEELGADLTCAPALSTVALAATALMQAGDTELLPAIAAGATTATLVTEPIRFPAGTAKLVIDGASADVVLATDGENLYALEVTQRTPRATLDPTRRLADIAYGGGRRIGDFDLDRTLDIARIMLAAECCGAAARVLAMSVAYATDRVQFGRPIGSFQAIQHKCADMHVAVETSRSAVMHATAAVDAGETSELATAASVALAWCAEAFVDAARETIQIHGGIGFTWEHDAHLFLKRATTSRVLLGDPAWHRERVARSLGW